MPTGSISNPIPVPGGFSGSSPFRTHARFRPPTPRDSVLEPKAGLRLPVPQGHRSRGGAAEPIVARFADAARNVGGCGGAEKLATDFHGEIVTQDNVKMRDLPEALQRLMVPMQVGQATQPFGSLDEGVRVLVMCGRDEVDQSAPSYDDIYNQINEERLSTPRARRYLADLRRDAVIEFR